MHASSPPPVSCYFYFYFYFLSLSLSLSFFAPPPPALFLLSLLSPGRPVLLRSFAFSFNAVIKAIHTKATTKKRVPVWTGMAVCLGGKRQRGFAPGVWGEREREGGVCLVDVCGRVLSPTHTHTHTCTSPSMSLSLSLPCPLTPRPFPPSPLPRVAILLPPTSLTHPPTHPPQTRPHTYTIKNSHSQLSGFWSQFDVTSTHDPTHPFPRTPSLSRAKNAHIHSSYCTGLYLPFSPLFHTPLLAPHAHTTHTRAFFLLLAGTLLLNIFLGCVCVCVCVCIRKKPFKNPFLSSFSLWSPPPPPVPPMSKQTKDALVVNERFPTVPPTPPHFPPKQATKA